MCFVSLNFIELLYPLLWVCGNEVAYPGVQGAGPWLDLGSVARSSEH